MKAQKQLSGPENEPSWPQQMEATHNIGRKFCQNQSMFTEQWVRRNSYFAYFKLREKKLIFQLSDIVNDNWTPKITSIM